MDKIDRNNSSSSDVTFVKCNVRSMLFVNDLALLSSNKSDLQYAIDRFPDACLDATSKTCGGGGGFTRPIPRDGGADQFRGIPIVGRLPTDGTRGPEEKGCGRKWPDAEGLVQGSRARDVRDPVVQNHSCCKKESRLYQPCGDKS